MIDNGDNYCHKVDRTKKILTHRADCSRSRVRCFQTFSAPRIDSRLQPTGSFVKSSTLFDCCHVSGYKTFTLYELMIFADSSSS